LDLADCDSGGGIEFRGFFLERVESVETEELLEDIDGHGVELVTETLALESVVEVLHNEILGVGCAETPEVDEEGVPGVLLGVSVLESFEG